MNALECPSSGDAPILFDAVLFDLDGTLVATESFWVEAARNGARRAFDELGLARPQPSAEEWLSMVGLPLSAGFAQVFADLDPAARAHVMARCVEEEELALSAGGATLMSGARELLESLRARGLRLGIASNCGRGYLRSMLEQLGLQRWIDQARCLDSAGVTNKADMVADLLATFGTRSAVMVGDRRTDAEAAHANGLPHVHLSGVIKPRGESVPCEARIDSLAGLAGVLGRRTRWIEGALEEMGALRAGRALRSLAITGSAAAGKSLFARDLVRVLEHHGRRAVCADLERWRLGELAADGDPLARYDVSGLVAGVLEPHAAGLPVPAGRVGPGPLDPDAVLVVEGAFLLHPRLRAHFDRSVALSISEDLSAQRVAARAAAGAAEELVHLRRTLLPALRAFEAGLGPPERADLVLDASNPLGPA